MRHPANELNFQVEDNCREGLLLKHYLVKRLNNEDTRTFGVCIGIKTRKKSEVFSSILIRRRSLLTFFGIRLLTVYDILCAHNFNPNERTAFVFSSNNPRFLLGEQLRRAITAFYKHRIDKTHPIEKVVPSIKKIKEESPEFIYQCKQCLTTYDENIGEVEKGIPAGTAFQSVPDDYCCPLCEGPKNAFIKTDKPSLGLQFT